MRTPPQPVTAPPPDLAAVVERTSTRPGDSDGGALEKRVLEA